MWRVTPDTRLLKLGLVLVILAVIAPLIFFSWDKLLIQEDSTNQSGTKSIEPQNLTCANECCDTGPAIKFCQGTFKCENNNCIKNDCPFECCSGIDYERKDCNNGFACVKNECRYAKELCGNGKCDPEHLECVYCEDECTTTQPNGTQTQSYYYYNQTGTCRPYLNKENPGWFINPDDKLVEVVVDNSILHIPGHMWSYFDLAQQWVTKYIEDNQTGTPYPTPTEVLTKRKGTDRERAFLMTSMFLDITQKIGLYQYENQSNMTYEIKTVVFPTKKGEHYFVAVNFGNYQTIYDTNSNNNTMAYSNQEMTDYWNKLFEKYGVVSQQATKIISYNYLIYQREGRGEPFIIPYLNTGKTVNIALTQQRNASVSKE